MVTRYSKSLSFVFILLFWVGIVGSAMAQQPSYQIVGEEFLEGKDIYSILEGQEGVLWLGTDEGLYAYDGQAFQFYENAELKNNSVFALKQSNDGLVYYVNLTGQVMRVRNDSLELFFQLPDSLMGIGIDIDVDEAGDVLVFCNDWIKIDRDSRAIELLYKNDHNFSGRIAHHPEGGLVIVPGEKSVFLHWKNGELQTIPHRIDTGTVVNKRGLELLELCNNQEQLIMVDRNGQLIYTEGGDGIWHRKLVELPSIKKDYKQCLHYALTRGGQFLCSCMDKGGYRYDLKTAAIDPHRILPNYYLSYYALGSADNAWIGTFNKGVLRVIHPELLDFRNHPFLQKSSTVALAAGQGDTLFGLTGEGQFYLIDEKNQLKRIGNPTESQKPYLEYAPNSERLYANNGYYDLERQTFVHQRTTSVKSTQFIPPNNLLLGDYVGVSLFSTDESPASIQELYVSYINGVMDNKYIIKVGRISTAHYQPYGERFWLGGLAQLMVLQGRDSFYMKHNGQSVVAFDMDSWEDTTYVGMAEGILVAVGTQSQGLLKASNAPILPNIRHLKRKGRYLYAGSKEGFQRIDLLQGTVQTFDVSDGLLANKIVDMALLEHRIYLLTSKGVQQLPYELLDRAPLPLLAEFASIVVDGQEVDKSEAGHFSYYENRLTVRFRVPYLHDRSTLVFRYRLQGEQEDWIALPVGQDEIRYNALAAGSYVLEVQAVDQKRFESPTARYAFRIEAPFWQRWWFVLLFLLGVALLVSLFFLVRIRILKQQNALLLDKKAVEKQLVESQQSALRAQMNPHFLFNALNSIQEMIIVNDKKAASNYLGKFADLMRLYLNQSQEECITLGEELQALQLYLELEQVRFEEHLTVELVVSPDLDSEAVTMPPMLVQPYVENAFKHGLLHQTEERQLFIHFVLDESGERFCCTIRDNGVGRAASARIRKAQGIHHYSFASSATQRRLELLNYNKKNTISVAIHDLTDDKGQATGTEVVLCIPFDWDVEA